MTVKGFGNQYRLRPRVSRTAGEGMKSFFATAACLATPRVVGIRGSRSENVHTEGACEGDLHNTESA